MSVVAVDKNGIWSHGTQHDGLDNECYGQGSFPQKDYGAGAEIPACHSKSSFFTKNYFQNIFLFRNNFSLIGKLQRLYREVPCTLHTVSSTVNILHFHSTFVKTKKLALVYYY